MWLVLLSKAMGRLSIFSVPGSPTRTLGTTALILLSCGGRAQDGVGQPSDGDDAPSDGGGSSTTGESVGGTFDLDFATTLDEADQMLLQRLEREGHGVVLTHEDAMSFSEDSCVSSVTECEIIPPHIEFVVDRGLGMKRVNAGTGRTNWDLVRDMLRSVIDELPGGNSVGLSFFPPLFASSCGSFPIAVPGTRLDDREIPQRELLIETLEGTKPSGDSERALVDAYQAAVDRLRWLSSPIVVLVTEGDTDLLEGCQQSNEGFAPLALELTNRVDAAPVSTLIVGTPGSKSTVGGIDARSFLSRVANIAKGVRCDQLSSSFYQHFDMSGEAPVAPLLTQALRSVSTCLPTFSAPHLPANTEVSDLRFFVQLKEHVFFVNDARPHDCTGYTSADGVPSICPETEALLACLPTQNSGWLGSCE